MNQQDLDKIDLSSKQDLLVSGTNIKSLRDISLLGSGDLTHVPIRVEFEGAPTVNDDDTAGYLSGDTIKDVIGEELYICTDNSTGAAVWISLTDLKTFLDSKGQANGVASLDGSGKVPTSQLPLELMEYKGNYNATTNTPALADTDIDKQGHVYRVTVAGTQDFGSGNITLNIGDWLANNGTIWEKSDNTDNTNLGEGTATNTTVEVNSSTGTSATLQSASTSRAGLLSKAKFDEIVANTAKVSNVTHTGEMDGATALTANKLLITNKTTVAPAPLDKILIADASDTDNLKNVTAQTIRDLKPTNYTYEISFNEVLDVLQRFTVATNITVITAYNVATLKYSLNGGADVTVTLPFAGTIALAAGDRIQWKITYTTGTLAVLNLTATEL